MSDSSDSPKPTGTPEQPQPNNNQDDANAKEQGTIVSNSADSPNPNPSPDAPRPVPPVNGQANASDQPAAHSDKASTLPSSSGDSQPKEPAPGAQDDNDFESSTRLPPVLKQTQLLSDQTDTGPMEQREPRPGTTQLGPGWRLRFKINDQTAVLDVGGGKVVIGRIIEEETGVDFDLTPFGAYHYGVSRQHAVLSLHDGFLYLEDNGSTNGTRINGFQMTPHQKYRLRDGDEIEFARLRTSIRFERPGGR